MVRDGDEPDDDPRTQFKPSASPASDIPGNERLLSREPEQTARRHTGVALIGALLNHIYRVDRFIASGGMGAVYEGINVNTDERVAIKIVLPHLAADPKIQALFRNEARTLTRLSHPGLAQYRVLAYEPLLDVFYIVTEFIDGPPLSDVLAQQPIGTEHLRTFAIRLASGLAAAHEWGTIHRDISPDNILLPLGKLEKAKIIDFGIAKDLAAMNQTVVGGGFAGKFSFVAPEQFDDPNGVGPWTDVYSLGLVLLTVARGAPPPSSISDAMKARESIPDLTALPADIRGIVAKMLEPDRTKRYQSMREVVGAFEEPAPSPARRTADRSAFQTVPAPVFWISGGALTLAVGFVAAMFLWSAPSTAPVVSPGAPAPPSIPAEEKLRRTIEASLGSIPCTWFDIGYPAAGRDGMQVELSGVSGTPDAVARLAAAARANGTAARIDATRVFAADRGSCGLLDAFRQFREPSSDIGRTLIPAQTVFHFQKDEDGCVKKGTRQARIVMDVKIGNRTDDFSILGMDATGGIQQLIVDRAVFGQLQSRKPPGVSDLGDGSYRWTFCIDQDPTLHQNALDGLLLIKGRGPFDLGLNPSVTDTQTVSADWLARFTARARAQHWTTQMAWVQILND